MRFGLLFKPSPAYIAEHGSWTGSGLTKLAYGWYRNDTLPDRDATSEKEMQKLVKTMNASYPDHKYGMMRIA